MLSAPRHLLCTSAVAGRTKHTAENVKSNAMDWDVVSKFHNRSEHQQIPQMHFLSEYVLSTI
jgi:hypothetical protein